MRWEIAGDMVVAVVEVVGEQEGARPGETELPAAQESLLDLPLLKSRDTIATSCKERRIYDCFLPVLWPVMSILGPRAPPLFFPATDCKGT